MVPKNCFNPSVTTLCRTDVWMASAMSSTMLLTTTMSCGVQLRRTTTGIDDIVVASPSVLMGACQQRSFQQKWSRSSSGRRRWKWAADVRTTQTGSCSDAQRVISCFTQSVYKFPLLSLPSTALRTAGVQGPHAWCWASQGCCTATFSVTMMRTSIGRVPSRSISLQMAPHECCIEVQQCKRWRLLSYRANEIWICRKKV